MFFRSATTPSPALRRAFLACLAVIFLAKAWFIIVMPLRGLVMSPWLLDDSFITMQVAKNVGAVGRFSFDGLGLTTGVTPLWAYIIALPIMGHSKEVAVPAILILSTLFGIACSWVIYYMASKFTDDRITPMAAGLLTALMPVQFFNAMNGMETAFFSLAVLLTLAGATGVLRYAKTPWKHGAITGLFLGIALLTRADAIFVVAAVGAWKTWQWTFAGKHRREILAELTSMGIVVACAFALFFLWQTLQTGSPFPDNQVGRRAIAFEKHGFDFAHFQLFSYLKISAWNIFELDALWSLATGSSLLTLLALAWAWTAEKTRPLAQIGTIYIGLFAAALCFYQWYFPDLHGLRYINAGSHLAILFTILLVAELFRGKLLRPIALVIFCVVLLGSSWYRYADTMRGYASFKNMGLFGQSNVEKQNEFWGAIDWVEENVQADEVIALRDHGRMAFFTDRTIADLAGILDADVLPARVNGGLGAYLVNQRNVSYIYLPDPLQGAKNVYQEAHDQLTLERIVGSPNQEITAYKLYKVLGLKQ